MHKSGGNTMGSMPDDDAKYISRLNEKLEEVRVSDRLYWLGKSINEKLEVLEKTIVAAARNCNVLKTTAASPKVNCVQELIEKRQRMRSEGVPSNSIAVTSK